MLRWCHCIAAGRELQWFKLPDSNLSEAGLREVELSLAKRVKRSIWQPGLPLRPLWLKWKELLKPDCSLASKRHVLRASPDNYAFIMQKKDYYSVTQTEWLKHLSQQSFCCNAVSFSQHFVDYILSRGKCGFPSTVSHRLLMNNAAHFPYIPHRAVI